MNRQRAESPDIDVADTSSSKNSSALLARATAGISNDDSNEEYGDSALFYSIQSFLAVFRIQKMPMPVLLADVLVATLYLFQALSLFYPVERNLGDSASILRFLFSVLRTCGLQFVTFEAYQFIALAQLIIQVIAIAFVVLVYRYATSGSATSAKGLVRVCQIFFFMNEILLLPLAFLHSTVPWNCDYSTNQLAVPTSSGTPLMCWTFSSISDMTGVFAILSLFLLFVQATFAAIWVLVRGDVSPVGSKLSLLATSTPILNALDFYQQVFLQLIMEALPADLGRGETRDWVFFAIRNLLYGSAVIFIFAMLAKRSYLYQKLGNSLFHGMALMRFAVWVSETAAQLAMALAPGNNNSRGLTVVIVQFALLAACYVIGTFCGHLIQTVRARRVVSLLRSGLVQDSTGEHEEIKESILSKISSSELNYVAMQLLPLSKQEKSRDIVDLVFLAIECRNAKKPHYLLLMTQAIYEMYVRHDPVQGAILIRKAFFYAGRIGTPFVLFLYCCLDITQKDVRENVISTEIRKLDMLSIGIQLAYKQFFGALLQMNVGTKQNRAQAKYTLEAISGQLDLMREEAQQKWMSLLRSFGSEPAVRRAYAQFLVAIDNNKDSAVLELAEQGESTGAQVKSRTRNGSVGSSNSAKPTNLLAGAAPIAMGNDDKDLDDLEDADMTAEVERSKHLLYARQIAKPRQHIFACTFVSFNVLLALALLVVQYFVTTGFESAVFLPTMTFDTCQIVDVTHSLVSSIRFAALDNAFAIVDVNSSNAQLARQAVSGSLRKAATRLSTYNDVYLTKNQTRLNSWMSDKAILDDPFWTDNSLMIRIGNTYITYSGVFAVPGGSRMFEPQTQSFVNAFRTLRSYFNSYKDLASLKTTKNANANWLNVKPLMWLYSNRGVVGQFFATACTRALDSYQALSKLSVATFFGISYGLFALRLCVLLALVVSSISMLLEQKKLHMLLAQAIPSATLSHLYIEMDRRMKSASKFYRTDVEQLPRFAVIGKKPDVASWYRTRHFWAHGLLLLALLIEVVWLSISTGFFVSWQNNEYTQSIVLRPSAGLKSYLSQYIYHLDEYFFNDNILLITINPDGNTSAITQVPAAFSLHAARAKGAVANVTAAYQSVAYHDSTLNVPPYDLWNGFELYDGPSRDVIKQLLFDGSCVAGANASTSIVSTPLEAALAGNDGVVFTNSCLPSLHHLLNNLGQDASVMLSAYKDIISDPTNSKNIALKSAITQQFINVNMAMTIFDYILDVYSSDVASWEVGHQQMFDGLFAATLICYVFIAIPLLLIYNRSVKRDHATRMILQFIPIKVIEASEELEEYVQQHKLPMLVGSHDKAKQEKDGDTRSKSILQACADGIFVLDDNDNVVEMNSSACKILSTTIVLCLGTRFERFVASPEDKIQLQRLIDSSKQQQKSRNKDGSAIERELTLLTGDGMPVPCRLSCSGGTQEGRSVTTVFVRDITMERKQKELIQQEKHKSEELLLNVLPVRIAQRLKAGEKNIADLYEDCTVLFSDMMQFARRAHMLSPQQLVQTLNAVIFMYDDAAKTWGIEKIKTIGDAYFAIAGLGEKSMTKTINGVQRKVEHPEQMCRFALEMMGSVAVYNASRPQNVPQILIRVGINTGPVTGGVIGKTKYMFDCFGDTVNTASRMESTAMAGQIQLTHSTYDRVCSYFTWTERNGVYCKGLGEITTYLLEGNALESSEQSINQ